jgi:assimilatory nitrate reductase catalytic subunit
MNDGSMPFSPGDTRATDVRTTCPYCGVGCGVVVSAGSNGEIEVHGDRSHPANFGRLCSKGTALGETLGLDGRLLQPIVDGDVVAWEAALDAVADRFRRIIEEHGPDAVAFYVSGQLLTEDYYVANKLMKGFIGSANIDTNSRLCMSSAVAAHKRAFGSDSVPCNYEDLECADLMVLVGTNLAWCHPVLYQRILQARKQRPDMQLVVVDPRRTPTADSADLHLPIAGGTDSFLFNGLLAWLQAQGCIDQTFVAAHTDGAAEALQAAQWHAPSPAVVAEHCGLDEADVERFFGLFSAHPRVVTLFSQGINQSSSGTDKGNAIINCHLLTGRIGQPGMGPFSITGQPNAMGGREVGGLSNQLAAHMDIANPEHRDIVQTFWQAPHLADREGLKAVDLFRAVENGKVRAVWVMATNPAVSLPDTAQVKRALAACECLVVSDCIAATDTMQYADIRLPALAWGEKSGTVTNSERRISRQRSFLAAPGEARPDWWMLAEVARRLGFAGFGYRDAAEVFDEHARLSAYRNAGLRDFDIGALVGLTPAAYDELEPTQWPCKAGCDSVGRLFGDGRFFTADGRARLLPIVPRPPGQPLNASFPLSLNTGRVRDHWHTMTRTGKSPRLSGHIKEPFVAIHPQDAEHCRLVDGGLARVSSGFGDALLRVEITEGQRVGQVFAPMHWNAQFAAHAGIGALVNPMVDPVSGQPEFKHTPVRVEPFHARWYGFLLTREAVDLQQAAYWSKAKRQGLWHYELAGDSIPQDWAAHARSLLCRAGETPEWRELSDSAQSNYRGARFVDGRLDAVLIIQPGLGLPSRDWLTALFKKDRLEPAERSRVLRGTPPNGEHDAGQIICSCFSVGINTLTAAIHDKQLRTPEAIGELLQAGTNCGSCVPELRRLIDMA